MDKWDFGAPPRVGLQKGWASAPARNGQQRAVAKEGQMGGGLFRSMVLYHKLGASAPPVLAVNGSGHAAAWDAAEYWLCGWGPMLFGAVVVLAIWVGVVAIDRLAIRRKINDMSGMDEPNISRRSALAILEERFAKGEIDREEFLSRRRDLG